MAFINMDCSEKFDQARPTQDTWTGLLRLNAHETGNADLIRAYQVFSIDGQVVDSHQKNMHCDEISSLTKTLLYFIQGSCS